MIKNLLTRKIWSVHNPLKVWTLHNLTQREVRLMVRTFSSAEVNLCLVWRPGWSDWKRLKDEAVLSAFVLDEEKSEAPPILRKHLDIAEEEITQIQAQRKSRQAGTEDRRHGRYQVSVPVEVIRGDQIFATTTVNVSESGVRFTQDLPDWVAGYFTMIFRVNNECFEITGALVEDQKDVKDKAEVIDTNDEESGLAKYLAWIKSLKTQGCPIVHE